MPAADDQIQSPSGTASKHFAFANWQVIDHVEDENVVAVEIIRTVAQSWSNGIHATEIITEVVSVRERVIRLELQAAREAVVQPRLQRLVVAAGIVAEEVAHNAGAAAGQCFTRGIGEAWITKFVEEWTTQIGRRIWTERRCDACSRHNLFARTECYRIQIVSRTVPSKAVRALIGDVGYFHAGVVRDLTLQRYVPGVERRQALECGAHSRLNVPLRTTQREHTIRGIRRECEDRWSLAKRECREVVVLGHIRVAIVLRQDILIDQHRQVLSNGMSKVGSEYADIKAAAITHAEHGLGCDLIRKPKPRRKGLVRVIDVTVQSIRADTGNSDNAFGRIGKSTVTLGVDSFWEIDLPSQPVVESQLIGKTPCILTVEEPPFLTLGSVCAHTYKAKHFLHVAKQEAGKSKAAISRT